jgi:hypothetical protein
LKINLAQKILARYQTNNWVLFKDPGQINIVYLEGVDREGKANDDRLNYWNDRRIVFTFREGNPVILGNWEATTEPSRYYTNNPLSQKGAARIAFGQYKAWKVGIHGNSEPHEALVQVNPLPVYRDLNKDGFRTGDKIQTGLFGINQHHGYDMPVDNVGTASAGCLVGRTRRGHTEFMSFLKRDPRYLRDKNFEFTAAILDGSKL